MIPERVNRFVYFSCYFYYMYVDLLNVYVGRELLYMDFAVKCTVTEEETNEDGRCPKDQRFQDALGAHSRAIAKAVGTRTRTEAQCRSHDQVRRNQQKRKVDRSLRRLGMQDKCDTSDLRIL